MRRGTVAVLALMGALTSCAPSTRVQSIPSSPGVVVVTADGAAIDTVAASMPARLGLRVSAARRLGRAEVTVALDGRSMPVTAEPDGSIALSTTPLPLGSPHHLRIDLGSDPLFDDDIRIIDVTHVMAAVHADGGAVALDIIFDDAPDRTAVAAAISAPRTQWIDDRHVHLIWGNGAPPRLHLSADLAVAHGSRLAGAVDLALLPTPAPGTLRRVTVPAAPMPGPLPVYAYAVATNASRTSVADHARLVDAVSPTGWRIGAPGLLLGAPDARDVAAARAAGARVLPLVQKDASNATGLAFLANPATRAVAVNAIAVAVAAGGYSGIHLDIEGIDASDRDHYSAFVTGLAAALHAQRVTLDVDVVPHKPGHLNVYSAGYDVPAIAHAADHIVVMAYDEHTQSTVAGPIAGLDWIGAQLAGTMEGVAPGRVILGLPLYARSWSGDSATAADYTSALAAALAAPGSVVDYDFAAASPLVHFTPSGESLPAVCYFDDAQSLAAKIVVAKQRGLAGVALWRLGFEDPALWDVVAAR